MMPHNAVCISTQATAVHVVTLLGLPVFYKARCAGSDMNLTAVFYDYTYSATYNVSTANNVAMWETPFEAINRYNIVRDGIEGAVANGIISQELGNQHKGELLFLRALTYHNLMIHFSATLQRGGQQ